MDGQKVELMVNEMITFLKKKKLWETDTGIIYNGKHISHKGTTEKHENLKGVARMWFEGPLNRTLNLGLNDPQFKIYNGLKAIMEKHGCYPEFDSNSDFNIYQGETV